MTVQNYNNPNTITRPGNVLAGRKGKIVAEWMAQQIEERNQQAVSFHPQEYYFYQQKQYGRLCSCHEAGIPDGLCPICFGEGWVGGYNKWGTQTFVFDTTHFHVLTEQAKLASSINFDLRTDSWTLESSGIGYIYWEMDVGQWSTIDVIRIIKNNNVIVQWKGNDKWFTLNKLTFDQKGKVQFRAILNGDLGRPIFTGIFLRFNTLLDTTIKINIPLISESRQVNEYGFYDSFDTINFWLPGKYLQRIGSRDWWYSLEEGTRWRNINQKPNKVFRYTLSWDITTRLVQPIEGIYQFPQ